MDHPLSDEQVQLSEDAESVGLFGVRAGDQRCHTEGQQQREDGRRERNPREVGPHDPLRLADAQEGVDVIPKVDEGAAGAQGEDEGLEAPTDLGLKGDEQVRSYQGRSADDQIVPLDHDKGEGQEP